MQKYADVTFEKLVLAIIDTRKLLNPEPLREIDIRNALIETWDPSWLNSTISTTSRGRRSRAPDLFCNRLITARCGP